LAIISEDTSPAVGEKLDTGWSPWRIFSLWCNNVTSHIPERLSSLSDNFTIVFM